MKKTKDLTPEHFRNCPVWRWDEWEEWLEPVDEWCQLPEGDEPLFVQAEFVAADGTELNGYLVGLRSCYAVGLFVGGKEFVLNFNLIYEVEDDIQEISKVLEKKNLELFPLKYSTKLSFGGERLIAGVIDSPS